MSDNKKNAKNAAKIFIAVSPAVLLIVFIICIVTPIVGIFTGQGTTFSLPEIIGRGTRINGEFSYDSEDEYDDRVWKWTIKKCRADVQKMQKADAFKTTLDATQEEKDTAWHKKVMATAVLYDQFISDQYVIDPANLDKSDPRPDNSTPWWKEQDNSYKQYYATILKKPDYSTEEWKAFSECFTGEDWTKDTYVPSADQTWTNLENLLGIEIDDNMIDSILQSADIMKDVVPHTYIGTIDTYGEEFEILPWNSEKCQEMWDIIFSDHDQNPGTLQAGLWERYPTNASDPMSGPQCTDFASWRCWKQYGFGTAGGNGDQVATNLVNKMPDRFYLSDTPAAGSIGSGRTSQGGIHVFWVESYDEETMTAIVSDGNYATRNANGILEYHGICLNRIVTLESLQTTYSASLNFAVPLVEIDDPSKEPTDPGDPTNPNTGIGSNLQNKY